MYAQLSSAECVEVGSLSELPTGHIQLLSLQSCSGCLLASWARKTPHSCYSWYVGIAQTAELSPEAVTVAKNTTPHAETQTSLKPFRFCRWLNGGGWYKPSRCTTPPGVSNTVSSPLRLLVRLGSHAALQPVRCLMIWEGVQMEQEEIQTTCGRGAACPTVSQKQVEAVQPFSNSSHPPVHVTRIRRTSLACADWLAGWLAGQESQ